jgi:hypothetical protein
MITLRHCALVACSALKKTAGISIEAFLVTASVKD